MQYKVKINISERKKMYSYEDVKLLLFVKIMVRVPFIHKKTLDHAG